MPAFDPNKVPKAEARRIYLNQRTKLEERFKGKPKALRVALDTFEANPAVVQMRTRAGLPSPAAVTVKTKKATARPFDKMLDRSLAPVKAAAPAKRKPIKAKAPAKRKDAFGIPQPIADVLDSPVMGGIASGVNDFLFGLPARGIAAAAGRPNAEMQAASDKLAREAPVTNILTNLGGAVITGTGAVKGAQAATTALARSATPAVASIGRGLETARKAVSLTPGQSKLNAARILGGGAVIGATDAAIKGRDVGEGAAYGAGGAAVGTVGIKGASFLGRKAKDFLKSSGGEAVLRKYAGMTKEQFQQRVDDFRARTGTEPTVYEILEFKDRGNIQQGVFPRLDTGELERGAGMARARVEAIPGEIAGVVRAQTRGQRKANIDEMASALPASRSGTDTTMSEARLAVGAADNPTRLAQLRSEEARNIMAPYDDEIVVKSVKELTPTQLVPGKKAGSVVEKVMDPEVARVISAVAGSAKLRDKSQGITVREVTGMLEELKNDLPKADAIERGVLNKAIDHLNDVLTQKVPQAGPALARMNEQYAARSRQLEGMREIRLQKDVPVGNRSQIQKSQNVFETPEGAVGRAMGQRGALLDDLERASNPALGTVRELAQSPAAARQLRQNIGPDATNNITDAATAQLESARRLASAARDPKFDAGEIEAGDLGLLAAALNPSSMAVTKARGLMVLVERLRRIPENRSRAIVDMLFSRDPAMTQRAINALRSEGQAGRDALRDIVGVMGGAVLGSEAAQGGPVDETALLPEETAAEPAATEGEPNFEQMSDEELMQFLDQAEGGEITPEQMSDEELMMFLDQSDAGGAPSGQYDAELQNVYQQEDPALLDLIQRVKRQESGGKQTRSDGSPVTSSAGAVGIMQVMPSTGPEAARLAGLPWDANAYRNDPAYNELIGIAYLSEMLRRYDGDVELALVAYNAGPGRADRYASGKIGKSQLPEETRKYLNAIM